MECPTKAGILGWRERRAVWPEPRFSVDWLLFRLSLPQTRALSLSYSSARRSSSLVLKIALPLAHCCSWGELLTEDWGKKSGEIQNAEKSENWNIGVIFLHPHRKVHFFFLFMQSSNSYEVLTREAWEAELVTCSNLGCEITLLWDHYNKKETKDFLHDVGCYPDYYEIMNVCRNYIHLVRL